MFKVYCIQKQVGTRMKLSMEILQEGIPQATSGTSPWHFTRINYHILSRMIIILFLLKMFLADLGKLSCSGIQNLHHLGIRSFLWSKDMGSAIRTTQRIGHIRSQDKATIFANLLPVITHRLEHTNAAIRCSTASQAHDEVTDSPAISMHNLFAYAPRSSLHRIALFGFY